MTYFIIIVAIALFLWFFGPTLCYRLDQARHERDIARLTSQTVRDMNAAIKPEHRLE